MTVTEAYRSFPSFSEWSAADLDLRFWHEALERLETERAHSSPEAVAKAHEFAIRAAAVDTAAIEGFYLVDRGFTFSVAAQTGAWQHYFDERGEKARATFEDQLRSFELVMDAATRALPMVEALIRSLHELVCASQDTYRVLTDQGWQDQELKKGEYKRLPNNPHLPGGRQHHYAPPIRVKEEMERLVAELATPAFLAAPAPLQAAYAHYAFVAIHPFADGNGRVARALTSIYLVRATSVPFVLFADQKPGYQDALGEADRGNWGAFSAYVRDRSMDAIAEAALALATAAATPPQGLQDQAARVLFAAPAITHKEADRATRRLLEHAQSQAHRIFDGLALPEGIHFTSSLLEGKYSLDLPGYRPLQTAAGISLLAVNIDPPAEAKAQLLLTPVVSLDPERPYLLGLRAEWAKPSLFGARYEEASAGISAALDSRLTRWLDFLVSSLVKEALERSSGDKSKSVASSVIALGRFASLEEEP